MTNTKTTRLFFLLILPFLITAIERLIIKPSLSGFPLSDPSIHLFKVMSICLLLLAFSAYSGKNYGLTIPKQLKSIIAGMFILLIFASYYFLFVLKIRGFFDELAVIHLVNLIVTVFREEFVLRGIIQTEAESSLPGKILHISQSIWLSTFSFSIWHLVNLTNWPWHVVFIQMLSCLPYGIFLGLIKEKTNNTLLTYLIHICGDLILPFTYTLLVGKLFFPLF